jgi:hypothetical protein
VFLAGPLIGGGAGGFLFSWLRQGGTATEVKEEPLVDEGR